MRDLGTSLKNSFSQTHLYQDNDVHMKKKPLTNKKYKIEEMVIAQNFTADCSAVAPLHLYLLLLVSNMLDSWKNCLDVFKRQMNKSNLKHIFTFLSCWKK